MTFTGIECMKPRPHHHQPLTPTPILRPHRASAGNLLECSRRSAYPTYPPPPHRKADLGGKDTKTHFTHKW